MMERQRLVTDDRSKGFVGEVDERKHIMQVLSNI